MNNENKTQLDNLNNLIHFDDLLNRIRRAETLTDDDYLKAVDDIKGKDSLILSLVLYAFLSTCYLVGIVACFSTAWLLIFRTSEIFGTDIVGVVMKFFMPIFLCVVGFFCFAIFILMCLKIIDEVSYLRRRESCEALAKKQHRRICEIVEEYVVDPTQIALKSRLIESINPFKELEKSRYSYWEKALEEVKLKFIEQAAKTSNQEEFEKLFKTNEE